jgi:hypothetical protein
MTIKTVLSALLAAIALSLAQLAAAGDVSGTWIMDVQTSAGSGKPTFILIQKGGELTGTYKGQLGEAAVTGSVQGDEVVINYKILAQGTELQVKYAGKVEGNTMSGKVKLGEVGEGTFKGTKGSS